MTSIAEKYAAQWLPNGEVSLADLIQAAVDEAQSVPVVGDAVGFVLLHEDGGKNLTFHDNTGELSDGWSQHKLVIQPTNSITAAELASLREKAAMVDELRKDAERYRWLRDSPESPIINIGYATDKIVDAAIAQGKEE